MTLKILTALMTLGLATYFVGCNGSGSGAGASPSNQCPTARIAKIAQSAMATPTRASHLSRAARLAEDLGKISDNQNFDLTIALQLPNEDQLQQELDEIYRPGSPRYHAFLKPEEFRSRYAPTEGQVAQVQAFLTTHGLTPLSVSDNRLLIRAQGTHSSVMSAFQTEIHQVRDLEGNSGYAPVLEPRIPDSLGIQAVHGLQNLMSFKSHRIRADRAAAPSAAASPGGYTPSNIRTAYRIPANLDGTGQTLALFELDGYTPSDITAYESYFSLPAVPLQNILIDGASGSAGGGAEEVSLDIELMIAVAPHAQRILVYEGANSDTGILDTYNRIATDNLARQVSTSWGLSEDQTSSSFMDTENTIFMQMAAQGQSIYSAAGDAGADDNGSTLSVDDPSSQPYVTGVGGTRLTLASDGSYGSETTWNDGAGSAGGGGISTVWSQPGWQNGLSTTANMGSPTMRNVPDVALNADPVTAYAIYSGGGWIQVGGTSCAAPLWAAFTALVNQERAAKGIPTPLGCPNQVIYQIGESSGYAASFFDIADGSTNLHYPATPGYDDATGWGSFNGTNLINDLATDPPTTAAAGGC